MNNKFLFFSSETTPPAGNILSKIYVPIENQFNSLFSGKNYGGELDSIGIIPICCAKEFKNDIKERKYVSLKRRYADFRLIIDFEQFIKSEKDEQVNLFIECVYTAIDILEKRLYKFDKESFLNDFSIAIDTVKKEQTAPKVINYSTIVDERLIFISKVCPEYIGGSDIEKNGILFKLYDELPKNISTYEKEQLYKLKLNECFQVSSECYPSWLCEPQWPIGTNGKPMRFIEQKQIKNNDMISASFVFEDVDTGEQKTVNQFI